ncbi:acyl-homoserine-lactone synthase [Sphingomonas sp. FW199]|uniref:acyl-homoserine-lactone synthase n=1 Tax=Sphingomonas sp. FW199 TaxID=3400217 RepID=UPI003CEA0C61
MANGAAQHSRISEPTPALRMFAARKRVFVDLLRWDVPVFEDRYERDQFDDGSAHYLSLDDGHAHWASARLLDTRRPHILGSLFPLLCTASVPCGPTVREITRFCIDPTLNAVDRRKARNALVMGLVHHALAHGITAYTGVAEIGWFRQIEQFGWTCRALGSPQAHHGRTLVGLIIRINGSTPSTMGPLGPVDPNVLRLLHSFGGEGDRERPFFSSSYAAQFASA